jgi:hypothetical protein
MNSDRRAGRGIAKWESLRKRDSASGSQSGHIGPLRGGQADAASLKSNSLARWAALLRPHGGPPSQPVVLRRAGSDG